MARVCGDNRGVRPGWGCPHRRTEIAPAPSLGNGTEVNEGIQSGPRALGYIGVCEPC
jgi:hypothetical protein